MKEQKSGGEKTNREQRAKVTGDTFKLKIYPDSALKMQSADVEHFDENLAAFVKKMRDTMEAYDGIGLAAPQVGVLKKIAVVEYENVLYVLINPKLISQEGVQEGDEGCLSFPGIYASVKRPLRVSISTRDTNGEERTYDADGVLARAFLHEMDHLEGRLFIEHLSNLKRGMIRKKMYKRAVGNDD